MAETKKMTQKDFYDKIEMICAEYPDIVEFCQGRKALLEKKNASRGTTKGQAENMALMDTIVAELSRVGHEVTISELMKESPALGEYSNQKLNSLFIKLLAEENPRVAKRTDKKKSYFSVIE